MAITITGIVRIYSLFIEAVTIMFTWAKVGKTKDIRELYEAKVSRTDLKGRGGA